MRLSKFRTSMPRLRIVPATDDKHVVNLGATGIVHAKIQVKKFATRRLGKGEDEITFSDNVQLDFNRAVTQCSRPSSTTSALITMAPTRLLTQAKHTVSSRSVVYTSSQQTCSSSFHTTTQRRTFCR